MQVSSVLDNPSAASSSSPSVEKTTSSFASHFLDAATSIGSDGSSITSADPADDAVKEFMDYAKETPEQRLFDGWLGTQGVSEKDFKAMSPAQQQDLRNKFEEQMADRMKSNALSSFNAANVF